MKKKMALLMAAIMALSPVSVFASTANRMDGTITTTKENTALMERTWMNKNGSNNGRDVLDLSAGNADNDKIEYVVQGSDLVISTTTDQMTAGDTFTITLDNAEWVFANNDSAAYPVTATEQAQSIYSLGGVTVTDWELNVFNAYKDLVTRYGGAATPLPTPTVSANPNNYTDAEWTALSPAAVPANRQSAVAMWNRAEDFVTAFYASKNYSLQYGTLIDELKEHSNTVGYANSFASLITGITAAGANAQSGLNSPFNSRFAGNALGYIEGQTDSSVASKFDGSNFDKSLGALTGDDAGAYLRFGALDTVATAAAAANDLKFPVGTNDFVGGLAGAASTPGASVDGLVPVPGAMGKIVTTTAIDTAATGKELPYMMRFVGTTDRRVATLTVLRDSHVDNNTSSASYLRVPMVVRMTGDGSAKVTVAPSNNSTVTGVTYTIGNVSGDGKTTTTTNTITARSTFALDPIKIKESVIGTITNGKIYLTAPYGYTFADPTDDEGNKYLTMNSSGGLRYVLNSTLDDTQPTVRTKIDNSNGKLVNYVIEDGKTRYDKIVINLSDVYTLDSNKAKVYEDVYSIERFNSIEGTLYIENVVLLAEDYAPFDKDVLLKISTGKGDYNAHITEESFKVAVRKDWIINLVASQPVPTLVNGRYAKSKTSDDFDGWHKTSQLTFSENVLASWWEERDTELALPDGVKFIQIEIKDAKDTIYDFKRNYELDGVYDAVSMEGARKGYVKVSGNKVTLTDLSLKSGEKGSFKMNSWVSIESGFEGDITLTAGGSGVPYEIAPVVIAKAVSPITIDTEVTDVKIGYQWQKVADFTINETGEGRILKDKQIVLSIDDSITQEDIYFAPDSVVEKSGNLSFTKPAVDGGHITFMLDRQSNGTAGAIKFSNVYVKIDRTVPESNNHPYKIVAHGDGIAANYAKTYKSYEPLFSTKGIGADYLNVVTAATDKPGVLSNTVRVSIGSDVVLVGRDNPQEIQMDTAAYISAESNSTMVPVRFVSVALGIPEGQIQWDEENRTVTINYTNTTVQMKAGSDQLTINGVTTTMYSPDVPPKKVTVEMKDNRSFLPFRQLGYALGVPVAWDDETRTAIYNAPEDLNTSSSVVADAE